MMAHHAPNRVLSAAHFGKNVAFRSGFIRVVKYCLISGNRQTLPKSLSNDQKTSHALMLEKQAGQLAIPSPFHEKSAVPRSWIRQTLCRSLFSGRICLRCKDRRSAFVALILYWTSARDAPQPRRQSIRARLGLCGGLCAFFVLPQAAFAACSPAGPAIASGATVNRDTAGGTSSGPDR